MTIIRVPIRPVAKERPRVTKAGITYTPMSTRRYEKAVAQCAALARAMPVQGPLAVTIVVAPNEAVITIDAATVERPKGLRGDLDNYAKAILDGLNKVAFKDDRQIVDLRVRFAP